MVDGARLRILRLSTLVILVPLVGACAHVGEDDFEATVADLREEMADGDRAVENRLGARIDALEERLGILEGDLEALEEEFEAEVERLELSLLVTPPVHFDFDDATLHSEYTPVLRRFAEVVGEHKGEIVVTVEGFTDPAGSDAYNKRLGMARAEAVRNYLTSQANLGGMEIRTVSYGEDRPRQVKPGEAGPGVTGWENRRVALVVDLIEAEAGSVADEAETQETERQEAVRSSGR